MAAIANRKIDKDNAETRITITAFKDGFSDYAYACDLYYIAMKANWSGGEYYDEITEIVHSTHKHRTMDKCKWRKVLC